MSKAYVNTAAGVDRPISEIEIKTGPLVGRAMPFAIAIGTSLPVLYTEEWVDNSRLGGGFELAPTGVVGTVPRCGEDLFIVDADHELVPLQLRVSRISHDLGEAEKR